MIKPVLFFIYGKYKDKLSQTQVSTVFLCSLTHCRAQNYCTSAEIKSRHKIEKKEENIKCLHEVCPQLSVNGKAPESATSTVFDTVSHCRPT